jgi:hypothetical protein
MDRIVCLLTAVLCAAGLARADQPKIDRTIAKEPTYHGKPQYGLLAFGAQGRDRTWLVRDGKVLYVDRKGNGDLTDPRNRVPATKSLGDPEEDGVYFEVGDLTVNGRTHKGLTIGFLPLKNIPAGNPEQVEKVLAKNPRALAVLLRLDLEVPGIKGGGVDGRVSFEVGPIDHLGFFQFADQLADTPVVRFGGPLEVTFYSEPSLRVGRSSELVLVVGTPGMGPGTFAMANYENMIPDENKPLAELSFSSAQAGQPPFKEKFEILDRC